MKKRLLGALLAVVVMLTGIPVQSFAADVDRLTEITETSISEETHIVGSENGAESERAEAIQPDSKKQGASLAKENEQSITPDETVLTPDETNQTQTGTSADTSQEAADSTNAAGTVAEESDEPEQVDATGDNMFRTLTKEYGVTIGELEREIGYQIVGHADNEKPGIGNFSFELVDENASMAGYLDLQITISLSKCKITLSQTSYSIDDFDRCPDVKIEFFDGTKSVYSETIFNYSDSVIYKNYDKVGTASVTISVMNSNVFTGTAITKYYTIKGRDISKCSVEKIAVQTYSGKAKKPKITVTSTNYYSLTKGTDYTLSYKDNKSIGTATILIKGKGYYAGSTKKVTFQIVPKKVSSFKVIGTSTSSIRLSWKKDSKVTGYEIYRYNEAKETFTKIKMISKKSTTTYVSTGLRSAMRNYYVIRSYKKVKGKKYYGAYASTGAMTSFASTTYASQYEEAMGNAVAALKLNGKSEYQKVRRIHDYICTINSYDWSYKPSGGFDVLLYGTSVCMGYAELFYDMAKTAGLAVDFMESNAQGHAWNMVRVDGQWYAIDVTWDDPDGDSRNMYQYFLLTEADMAKDHIFEGYYSGSGYIGYSGWMNVALVAPYANIRATYNLATMNYLDKLALKNTKFASVKSTYTKSVTLKWNPQSTMTKYEIYRSTKKKSGYKKVKSFSSGWNMYTDNKVKSGKTYYYKIRCYKTVNGKKIYGKYSAVKSVKVK